jgi:hypothetical protein
MEDSITCCHHCILSFILCFPNTPRYLSLYQEQKTVTWVTEESGFDSRESTEICLLHNIQTERGARPVPSEMVKVLFGMLYEPGAEIYP